MAIDTVYARTRSGALASVGQGVPISGGFRQLLRLIDGRKPAQDVLKGMEHIDAEDFDLWIAELLRQGLIAVKGEVPVDEMAFSMTTEMTPSMLPPAVSAEAESLIDDIMADVAKSIAPEASPSLTDRLRTTGRMAAIESSSASNAVGRSGFFVYPDASVGLPRPPRVCIAGHVVAQNRVLELLLQRSGIKPAVVTTRDALRATLAGADKPHVLFVDAEMPMVDAMRTLDAMRGDAALKDVRVVLISSRGERTDLAQAIMLGVTAYIVKPLRKEVLDLALPQLLGGAAAS